MAQMRKLCATRMGGIVTMCVMLNTDATTRTLTIVLSESEWRELRVQLVRAAMAVPRHIAEAAARTSAADRRARFQVARGECAECDATLDVLAAVTSSETVAPLQHLAARTGALLSGLILRERRRLAARAPDAG